MAYQTGSVASATALKTIIKDFAASNGWTVTGDLMTKDTCSFKLWLDTPIQYGGFTYNYSGYGGNGTFKMDAIFSAANYMHSGMISVGDVLTIQGSTYTAINGTPITITGAGPQQVLGTGVPTSIGSVLGDASPNVYVTGDFGCLFLEGYTDTAGTLNKNPYRKGFMVPKQYWPVTYHLFANTSPNLIVCTIVYNTNECQTMMFGNISKVHDSAYVGGGYYWGSCIKSNGRAGVYQVIDNSFLSSGYVWSNTNGGTFGGSALPNVVPFGVGYYVNTAASAECLHAEIDSLTWLSTTSRKAEISTEVMCLMARSPNTWNSQAHLIPFSIYASMASSYYSYLGHLEHCRLVRIDNYELGDIITIGTDRWKVFPAWKKDITARSGTATAASGTHSGTVGMAFRYDGP